MEGFLDFTNFREHPTNRSCEVYHFDSSEKGDYFETLLQKNSIWFERFEETEDGKFTVYFGVKKVDSSKVRHLNNLTIGKFRSRFIPDAFLRIFIMLISAIVLGLAIAGFFLAE